MRQPMKTVTTVLSTLGLVGVMSLPLWAQSRSRTSPPRGSGDRNNPPAGYPLGAGEQTGQQAPLALKGYCAVSILEMRKWVEGDPAYRVAYDGHSYLFANEQGEKLFEANPAKYVPALGGDCVVALVKMGKRVPGDIRYSAIHSGRLYLFSNPEGKKMFLADPAAYASADLALGGKCPVCAAGGHDMPGKPEIAAFQKGLRYLFPSAKMRDMFLASPQKYVSAASKGTKLKSGSSTKEPSSGSATKESEGSGSSSR